MKTNIRLLFVAFVVMLFSAGCSGKSSMVVNKGTVQPGAVIQKGSVKLQLIGKPLQVGMKMPDVVLADAFTMKEIPLSDFYGKVVVFSIVPSLDTKVCEAQTHYLGEEGDRLPSDIKRVTISRDTPMAQKRFAEEAKLTDVQYLSDHRDATFGKATGLLIDKNRLLARSVLVIDKSGTVQHIQVVPQLGELPDLEAAFDKAIQLAE